MSSGVGVAGATQITAWAGHRATQGMFITSTQHCADLGRCTSLHRTECTARACCAQAAALQPGEPPGEAAAVSTLSCCRAGWPAAQRATCCTSMACGADLYTTTANCCSCPAADSAGRLAASSVWLAARRRSEASQPPGGRRCRPQSVGTSASEVSCRSWGSAASSSAP